jgi:hypothetical protein
VLAEHYGQFNAVILKPVDWLGLELEIIVEFEEKGFIIDSSRKA